jgi:hypothetical protein
LQDHIMIIVKNVAIITLKFITYCLNIKTSKLILFNHIISYGINLFDRIPKANKILIFEYYH